MRVSPCLDIGEVGLSVGSLTLLQCAATCGVVLKSERSVDVVLTVLTLLPLGTGTKHVDSAYGVLILAKTNLALCLHEIGLARACHDNVAVAIALLCCT